MKLFWRLIAILVLILFTFGTMESLFGQRNKNAQLVKFGTLAPDNTPWSAILQNFKKIIQKETKDLLKKGEIKKRLKVKLYLNGIKGDEKAMLEQIRYKKLTGGGFSTGGMSSVVPELQIFEVPFLFNNDAEADYIMDKVVLKEMEEYLHKRGLYLYCWAINGWYDFGSNVQMIRSPDDLNGCKIYSQESPVQEMLYTTLDLNPVLLAVPEVYPGLQSKMINTYSSTPIYALAAQWFTQTKYWTDSNHVFQPAAVVFGKEWWDSLDPKIKKLVLSHREELQSSARKDVRSADDPKFSSRDDEIMAVFGGDDVKMKVSKLTKEERKNFKNATKNVSKELIAKGAFSQELWDRIQKSLEKFRSQ